jgi:hypothetical protein
MAIEIDFGRELGRLAFPDDITDEQAKSYVRENYQAIRQGLLDRRRQELAAETESEEAAKFRAGEYGLAETAINTLTELPKGALKGIGEQLGGFARVFEAGDPFTEIPLEEQQRNVARSPITQAGQQIEQFAEETYPGLPGVRETMAAQVMGGIGSTASTLPAALAAGPAAPLTAGIAYGLQSGEAAARDADRVITQRIAEAMANNDVETARDLQSRREQIKSTAFVATAPIGAASEVSLGITGKLVNRFTKGRIGGIGSRLAERMIPRSAAVERKFLGVTGAERIRGAVEGMATEGAQEFIEETGGNVVAGAVYDPERGWLDGSAEAGFIGAVTGGLLGGLTGSKADAQLAAAVREAAGADPTNPLPRSNATVAGIESTTPTEGYSLEPDITEEDVLRRQAELGIPLPEGVPLPAPAAPAPAPIPEPAPEPAAAAQAAPITGLTSEAAAILNQVDAGGAAPAFVSANLQRIAEENGVRVESSDTPNTIIEKLRRKTTPAAAPAAVSPETGLTTDEQDELDQLITAEDAGLLSEEGAITLAAYRARLGFPAQPTTPTEVVPELAPVPAPTPTPAPAPAKPRSTTGLAEIGEMGAAIGENLRETLWNAFSTGQGPRIALEDSVVKNAKVVAEKTGATIQKTDFITFADEFSKAESREEKIAAMQRLASKAAPAPAPAPTPVTPAAQSTKLPKDLAGAKPRYNVSTDAYLPRFDSDFDLAAFIVTQSNPSKRDADYLNWAVERSGMTPDEVRKHGLKVRAELKQLAAKTKGGTSQKPATLTVPSVLISMSEVALTPALKPAVAPAPIAPAPATPTRGYTDADFAAAPSREAASEMAVTQVRTNPSLPPRPQQIFYTLQAVANRAARKPYDPQNLTAELVKQAQDAGLITAAKNPKLTTAGQQSLADGTRQSEERKAAQANLSDALRERAVLAWDAANDPQSAAYKEKIAAAERPAAEPVISEEVELNELRIAKQQRGRLSRLNEERLQELEKKLAPAPVEPVTAEPTEAELQAAEEARLAQAEEEIDAGPIGQAKQKLEDEGSDMTKRQVKAMARKLEASGVIDDSELDDEGRDTEVDELVGQLLERVEEARDTAIQEREQELAEEAGAEKAAPKTAAPVAAPTPAAPAPTQKAAKDPATMTASEINKELDRLDTESSAITDELIAVGRGSELTSETLKGSDPISLRARANFERRSDLRREISSRYGPNAPSRLPAGKKGFGPRKQNIPTAVAVQAAPLPTVSQGTPAQQAAGTVAAAEAQGRELGPEPTGKPQTLEEATAEVRDAIGQLIESITPKAGFTGGPSASDSLKRLLREIPPAVLQSAALIAQRVYRETRDWAKATQAGIEEIFSRVKVADLEDTRAGFSEFIQGVNVPGSVPANPPQPAADQERVDSRGYFTGQINPETVENWQAESKRVIDSFGTDMEAAFRWAATTDMGADAREFVFKQIMERVFTQIARANNPIELARAEDLLRRVQSTWKSSGTQLGQAFAARAAAIDSIWYLHPLLAFRDLVRERQAQLPFPQFTSDQVRQWLQASGRQAVEELRIQMQNANNAFGREFRRITKDVLRREDINWADILTASDQRQGSMQYRLLEEILSQPGLRNLPPRGISEIVKLFSEAWGREQERIFRNEFRKQVPLPTVKKDDREKIFRSIPRILRYSNIAMMKDGAETRLLWDQAFRNAVAPQFGVAAIDGTTARKLTALAQKAQSAAGINRDEIVQQMFRLMQKEGGINWKDILRDYWYAAVLSGTRTQVDNALNIANGALNTAMFAGMAGTQGGKVLKAAGKGLSEAIKDFWPILWKGELYRSVSFNPDVPGNSLEGLQESRNLFLRGISQLKYVSRLMQALDHMTALMSDAASKAYTLAKTDPKLLEAYMLPSATTVANARARAIAEGTRPELVNRRTREIIEEALPVEVLLTARDIRQMSTFTETPQGLAGAIYQGVNAAERQLPGLKFLSGTSFVRFASNYANELLNYFAPVALWRWYQSAPGRQDTALGLKYSEARRDLLLSKLALGTALTGFAAALFLGDDDDEKKRAIDITGSFKSLSPEKRNQLLAEGRQPYSIRVGDTYISYRQLGFGGVLGAIGELRDQQLFSPEKYSKQGLADKLLDGFVSGALIIKDASSIAALTEFLGFANAYKYDVSQTIEKATPKYLARLAGSVIPNIMKEADAWIDSSIYRAEPGNLGMEYFLQQVPFARQSIGPGPILNVLGEPVQVERYPYSRWLKFRKEDKAWNTLGQLASKGVFMPTPNITVTVKESGERRRMNRDEAYTYQKDVGQRYRTWIERNGDRLLKMKPDDAAEVIDKAADRMRADAREKIQQKVRR